MKKLLLISNSTMAGKPYLEWPKKYIKDFLDKYNIKNITFVPFAGVALSNESIIVSFDVYTERVANFFGQSGVNTESVHKAADPLQMIRDAEAVVVGGGNTFHLVGKMHDSGIMQVIREKAEEGVPYIGWSAGSNVACPTLMTTNDMPIFQPQSFKCLDLIPFQINPHYLDANPEGHGGETRQQRIEEFLVVNRSMKVAGLREASLLQLEGDLLKLYGSRNLRLFEFGKEPVEYSPGSDLSFLLA